MSKQQPPAEKTPFQRLIAQLTPGTPDPSAQQALTPIQKQEEALAGKSFDEIIKHLNQLKNATNEQQLKEAYDRAITTAQQLLNGPSSGANSTADNDIDDTLNAGIAAVSDSDDTPAPAADTQTTPPSKLNDLMKPISEVPNKPGSYHVPPDSVGKIMSTVNKNHGGGLNALGKQGYGVIDQAEAQAILGDQKKLAELVTKMTGVTPGSKDFNAAQDHVKKALQSVGKGGCVGLAVSTQAGRANLHKDIQTATNGQAKFVEQKGPVRSTRAPTPAPSAKRQRAEPSPSTKRDAFEKGAGSKAGRRLRANSAPVATARREEDNQDNTSLFEP